MTAGAEWDGEVETDPQGISAPFPGETRAQACRRWAAEDEIEEDPARASREQQMIRALQDEELFAAELSRPAITSLPRTVRALYKRNPGNPKVKALYEELTAELYARADDVLRGSLLDAVEEMVALMDCGDPAIRLRASTYVFERLRGKTPEVLNVTQDRPFEVVFSRITTGARIAAERVNAVADGEGPIDAEIVPTADSEPGTGTEGAAPKQLERARHTRRKTQN